MRSSYIEGHVQVTQYFVYIISYLITITYSGGGGGSRTRVPKVRPRRTLHACPLSVSRSQRKIAAKTAGTQTRSVLRSGAESPSDRQPA